MSQPNYRQLSPPADKHPTSYTWSERRSELYDMIERAGHYRNLERSQRELAGRYDVSVSLVNRDIHAVNEWIAEHLGQQAEAELETLKTSAVQHLIDQDKPDKAFYLMMNFYDTLMETKAAGQKREPEEQDHRHDHEHDIGRFERLEAVADEEIRSDTSVDLEDSR